MNVSRRESLEGHPASSRGRLRLALAASCAFGLGLGPCLAARGQEPARQEPAAGAAPIVALEPGAVISLAAGRSRVLKAPWRVSRVSVSEPRIADVEALAPDQLLLLGKAPGSTDLVLWGEGDELWQARIDVGDDLAHLRQELEALFPQSRLELSRSQEVVVVRGLLSRAEHAEQLRRFLEASELRYVDMTRLAGVQQVQIQVRVAEVSRQAVRALGINALHTGRHFFGASTVGSASGGAPNRINIAPPEGALATRGLPFIFNNPVGISPLVTLLAGFPDADLQLFVQALAENQYLRILSEPNLVALSGEEASFLAGGEFPIPVVQGGANAGSITIEYREFGVRLRFRPTVLGDGRIRLVVAPEVSDLTDVGAIEIQGFRVPSLLTRRAETTFELQSGQTFSIAGLLSRRNDARNSRVPVAGDLPVLGALFRSTRYQSGETEMVVLVTASLVEPSSSTAPPAPGVAHTPPGDWELYTLGSIEGAPPHRPPPPAALIRKRGFHKLRGPGAWTEHGAEPARSRAGAIPEEPAAGEESGAESDAEAGTATGTAAEAEAKPEPAGAPDADASAASAPPPAPDCALFAVGV
jgi:pilus assembly protein CpaC